MSMTGKWNYSFNLQFPYGDTISYEKGMAFLDGRGLIEDWGCGTGFARRFVKASEYRGIDGSSSPFCDVVADLTAYTSDTDCIFMRHVLEHNWNWELILRNALTSFKYRMVLITFIPFGAATVEIGNANGIPDISLSRERLANHLQIFKVAEESISSDTQYGAETIFFIER